MAAGSARVLGGDMSFEGGSQGDTQRFAGQGTATAEALRNAAELGWISRLPLSGQAGYRATLAFVGGQPQYGVTSNLVGLGVDLPHPLGKAAPAAVALRVQNGPDEGAPGERGARSAAGRRRQRPAGAVRARGLGRRGARGSRCDPAGRAGGGDAGRIARAPGPARRGRDRDRRPQESQRRRVGSRRRPAVRRAGARHGAGPGASTPAAAPATCPTTSACASAS